MNFPKVSILIPFRNEEKNIPVILESIRRLDYPPESLEVLLGNDASEDDTADLLQAFAEERDYVRLIHLNKQDRESELKGKPRVLARLAGEAKGEYYFFTDADIELPENWIRAMLSQFSTDKIGVVVGVTGMKPSGLKASMQSMEWLTVLFLLYIFSKFGLRGTGMGNNMAVRRTAYWSTGGYAQITFSIVEDYALYEAILKKGFEFRQAFDPNVLAWTVPPDNFFEQRKRWLTGGFQSKSMLVIPGLIQTLWIPILILVSLWSTKTTCILAGASFVMLWFLTFFWQIKLKLKGYLWYVPVFWVYLPVAWLLIQLNYFLPGKVKWKNRTYE